MKTFIKPKHVAFGYKNMYCVRRMVLLVVTYQHDGMNNLQLILCKGDMNICSHTSHTL